MPDRVAWSLSLPTGPLSGVVYCLHGKSEDHRFAFDVIHLHDFVAADAAGGIHGINLDATEINAAILRHHQHSSRRRLNLQLVDKGSADLEGLILGLYGK